MHLWLINNKNKTVTFLSYLLFFFFAFFLYLNPKLAEGARLFSDLPGFLAPGGGSVPPHVIVTNLRPDIVIINESLREVVIFELTCPWDSNIDRSHAYKEDKYAPLVADISHAYTTYLFYIEISVRGQVSGVNKKRLKSYVYRSCVDPKPIYKSLVEICSKIALLSSYSIFTARNEPTWESPSLLINH